MCLMVGTDWYAVMHIKEILGHAYVRTTEAYTHIPTPALREAVEALMLEPSLKLLEGQSPP
jgi:site-specific recombinase XerD